MSNNYYILTQIEKLDDSIEQLLAQKHFKTAREFIAARDRLLSELSYR